MSVAVPLYPAASCSGLPLALGQGSWPQSCRNKTAGYKCEAVCDAGFRLPPLPTATCLTSGNWSSISGRCKARGEQQCGAHDRSGAAPVCLAAKPVLNLLCFLTSFQQTHSGLCLGLGGDGNLCHRPSQGATDLLCRRLIDLGGWLSCAADPVPCPGEPSPGVNPPNAQWNGNCADMPHTGVCFAVCNPGFLREPRPSATCEDGMWLPVNGTCQQAKAAETQDASQLVATATTPNATAGELLLTRWW